MVVESFNDLVMSKLYEGIDLGLVSPVFKIVFFFYISQLLRKLALLFSLFIIIFSNKKHNFHCQEENTKEGEMRYPHIPIGYKIEAQLV